MKRIKKTRNEKLSNMEFVYFIFYSILLLFPFVYFFFSWWIMDRIIDIPFLGAAGTMFLFFTEIVVLFSLIAGAKPAHFENPKPFFTLAIGVSFSFMSIFNLVILFASFSYLMGIMSTGSIEIEGPISAFRLDNLVETYLWHLVDTIPFSNVEKTFGMKGPVIQFKSWLGGTPVLIFRLFVIIALLGGFKEVWTAFKDADFMGIIDRKKGKSQNHHPEASGGSDGRE